MEALNDPTNNRQVKTVRPPPHKPLTKNLIWPADLNGKPNWKCLRDHLSKEGRIEKQDFLKLIADTNKIFESEGNLLQLQDPLTVVGDIHGQFYDLLKILEVGGNPYNTKYLFLGDFVDRGSFSIEVLILLYAVKINFPNTVYFLRGNHECRQMTSFFNFRDECKYKYDQDIYDVIMDSFDLIPLSCIVNNKFLALHGGISPDLKTLKDIEKIDRRKEPPRQGIFCDMLWSDPVDNDDGLCDSVYKSNEVRGCSYFFGNEAVRRFLDNNNLISIIRAHEAQLDGYKMHRWNGKSDFPAVITIFSAPNYCDVYNNKGAVIKFENNTLHIQQFNYTQHPYLLPNFMDIFTWSIPFVSEKVTEMLYCILKSGEGDGDNLDDIELSEKDQEFIKSIKTKGQNSVETSNSPKKGDLQKILNKQNKSNTGDKAAASSNPDLKKKADVLRTKIKFMGKMMIYQKTLREERENIMKLKGQSSDAKIPVGLLSQGSGAIKNTLDSFNSAKNNDMINEKRPEFGPYMKDKSQQVKQLK